jgi:glycosyltransferase involved in cell wall biosynthesis
MRGDKFGATLVSCIMPTYNRRAFLPHAIRYFLRQDYPSKELIIIDDGTDNIEDLVPCDPSIHYCRLDQKITLGAKLNLACSYANGDIIANWDDDDWYAPGRLTYQVNTLEKNGTSLCGINNLLYFDVIRKTGFQYIYPGDQRVWLLGSSMCYKKALWQRVKFADINVGMDGLFVWATPPDEVKVLDDSSFSVHMIHENNISPKKTNSGWWHPYPVNKLESLMRDDWHIYSNGVLYESQSKIAKENPFHSLATIRPAADPVKNVFSCLVHENEDCIIDLVRNLHYHDPASHILLYNGGENNNLLANRSLFEKFGAIIHPDPRPVRHGYLHDFALRSMQFAVDNFTFDTFTIVDSDQLLLRSNYSSYLAEFFKHNPKAGLLSSDPSRINANNKVNQVALQAFKEYELWKPLLQTFPGGEDKFVHWTFWPSTVFTAKAIKDLLKLFSEDDLVKKIIRETKIWATEEVVFPTLVGLLGYEIALNPCHYDFVKYRTMYKERDVAFAVSRENVYWIHPVERKYENALRKQIRQQFNHYVRETKNGTGEEPTEMAGPLSLLKRVEKIKGWLTEKEADLLIATTIKACKQFPSQHRIVEVGCYEGKVTVLLGLLVREFFPDTKITAIDPHDGKLGALDQGFVSVTPSLSRFIHNIQHAGLNNTVETIQGHAWDIKWQAPISFLIIDGLHDYPNVSRDFWEFAASVNPEGYVAFHDYADYYPGVIAFVNELLQTGCYRKMLVADSLIVLQKL